ncbi:MAG TPA: ComEC/Rec2 family competence protein [Nitrolancea sp.]|nr:ComEC/Rec2 family competence protein [Nitrolancea sp.]
MAGIVLAVAFLAGVLLHDSGAGWVLALPLLAGGIAAVVLSERRSDRLIIAVGLLLLAFGAWRAGDDPGTAGPVAVQVGADRSMVATIVGIPRRGATRVSAEIRLRDGQPRTITVSLPLYPEVNSGDEIRFWASSSWERLSADSVLLPISGTSGNLFIPTFVIERSSTSPLTRLRIRMNDLLQTAIERYVPEPAGALTLGILNGDDTGMTETTRQRFRLSGMSHITAVSGWNVALVAGLVSLLTRRLAPTSLVTLLAGVAAVWAYAFIVGMGPSVVRAAGMATVFLAARWRGRQGDLVTSMLVTVAVIVALSPSIRFDIGFQLSVAATLGIVLLVEQFPLLPGWQSALALPFVAQLATAPLQLHHFATFSPLAPLANLVVAPLISLVMSGGVLTVLASWIHPTLAEIAGAVTWLPARLIVAVAEHEPRTSGSSDPFMALSWSATFVTYLALALGYCGLAIRFRLMRRRASVQADTGI